MCDYSGLHHISEANHRVIPVHVLASSPSMPDVERTRGPRNNQIRSHCLGCDAHAQMTRRKRVSQFSNPNRESIRCPDECSFKCAVPQIGASQCHLAPLSRKSSSENANEESSLATDTLLTIWVSHESEHGLPFKHGYRHTHDGRTFFHKHSRCTGGQFDQLRMVWKICECSFITVRQLSLHLFIGPRWVVRCRQFCWHHQGLRLVLSNKFPCLRHRKCLTIFLSLAFQISRSECTGSTKYGVSASTEVEHHVLSDTIPFSIRLVNMSSVTFIFRSKPKKRTISVRESSCIFCNNLGIRNTQICVSLYSPYNVVVHGHEDDSNMSRCRASFLFDHLDRCFVVFKDIQQNLLKRRMHVCRNKINIVWIINLSKNFLSRWRFIRVSPCLISSEACFREELVSIKSHKSSSNIPSILNPASTEMISDSVELCEADVCFFAHPTFLAQRTSKNAYTMYRPDVDF